MTDDGFNLNATQVNYLAQFIQLRNQKINSLDYIKVIWTEYYRQKINLAEARSITCKINAKQLSNEAYIKKIYAKLGLAATTIDVLADCIKIAKNDHYSDQQKNQEISKKIIGNVTSTAVGMKTGKYVTKLIKILRSSNLITVVAGFAIDIVLSYYIGQTTDDLTEELLQKVFDYIG